MDYISIRNMMYGSTSVRWIARTLTFNRTCEHKPWGSIGAQSRRKSGFEGFGQTPISNQDLIIASYLGSLILNLSKHNSLHISNLVENTHYADQISSKNRCHKNYFCITTCLITWRLFMRCYLLFVRVYSY